MTTVPVSTAGEPMDKDAEVCGLIDEGEVVKALQVVGISIAGLISNNIITAPLSRISLLFQVQSMHDKFGAQPTIMREASRILKEEGFRAFYKGNKINLVRYVPVSAIWLSSQILYSKCLKSLPGLENPKKDANQELFVDYTSDILATITSTSATYPMDVVRTRLALQRADYYRGSRHAFQSIYKFEGVSGLYKGYRATLLKQIPKRVLAFSSYELLLSYLQPNRSEDPFDMTQFFCGGLTGTAATTAMYPVDLVKRRLQVDGIYGVHRVYNAGLFGTVRHIIKEEGTRGLYKGITPRLLKAFPSYGLFFMLFKTLKGYMPNASTSCSCS